MKLTLEQLEQMVLDEMYKKYNRKAPLGKYVFPKYLTHDLQDEFPDAERERDTPLEKIISKALRVHVARNRALPNNVIKKLKNLMYAGHYPEIFKFRNEGLVYRGMNLSKEFIQHHFGSLPKKPVWYKQPIDWWNTRAEKVLSKNMPYSFSTKTLGTGGWYSGKQWSRGADSKASSWTDSFQAAKGFAGDNKDGFAVILVADASKNRDVFIDLDPLYKLFEPFEDYDHENELIATDDVRVHSIIWNYLWAGEEAPDQNWLP